MRRTFITVFLSGFILFTIVDHLKIIGSSSNEIDNLNQVLTPVKTLLDNQPIISLIANKEDYALYYQTQFILVPTIVENKVSDNDTLLVIEKKSEKKISFARDRYTILFSDSNQTYNVFLIVKPIGDDPHSNF